MNVRSKQQDDGRCLHWHTISGYIAMWAVRQSPYYNPDGLSEVLVSFNAAVRAKFDSNGMAKMTRGEVKAMLKEHLWTIPQFQKWNERRNGNQNAYQFVSSHDGPRDPDNDFIDLDALTGNVVREMFRELDRDFASDQDFDRRWKREWFKRWWYGFKQRLFPIKPCDPSMNAPTPP